MRHECRDGFVSCVIPVVVVGDGKISLSERERERDAYIKFPSHPTLHL